MQNTLDTEYQKQATMAVMDKSRHRIIQHTDVALPDFNETDTEELILTTPQIQPLQNIFSNIWALFENFELQRDGKTANWNISNPREIGFKRFSFKLTFADSDKIKSISKV